MITLISLISIIVFGLLYFVTGLTQSIGLSKTRRIVHMVSIVVFHSIFVGSILVFFTSLLFIFIPFNKIVIYPILLLYAYMLFRIITLWVREFKSWIKFGNDQNKLIDELRKTGFIK